MNTYFPRLTCSKLKGNLTVCIARTYAKAFQRTPVKVLTRDGVDISPRDRASPARPATPLQWTAQGVPGSHGQEDTTLKGLIFRKLNDSDKKFQNLYSAAKHKPNREKKGVTVLEGKKLIADAVKAGAQIKGLYFTYPDVTDGIPLDGLEDKLFKISHRQLNSVTDVAVHQGVIALCEIPNRRTRLELNEEDLYPFTLVCDSIREPGNMGTLLRSAAAVGCKRILVSEGSVDVWEPKVVRAGAGAHFQTTILHKLPWHSIRNYISPGSCVNLAETKDTNLSCGSELFKSQSLDRIEQESMQIEEENGSESSEIDPVETLPLCNVYDAEFSDGVDNVLIIGNESHGLSEDAYRLAADRQGRRVHVPMRGGVDSLNAAMAGTALLFEIKRQLYLQKNR